MTGTARFPALAWLLLSYVMLASAFLWAGRQTGGTLAGWVFLGCLALVWLPLYVFLNRAEIFAEKAFWFSHAAAALVVVAACAAMAAWTDAEPAATHKRPDNWPTLLSGVAFFMLFQQSSLLIIRWLARRTQERVEKALSQKPGQD